MLDCASHGDCPGDQECVLDESGTFRSCVDANQPICGNGVIELGEDCDSGIYNVDGYITVPDGVKPCNTTCSGAPEQVVLQGFTPSGTVI